MSFRAYLSFSSNGNDARGLATYEKLSNSQDGPESTFSMTDLQIMASGSWSPPAEAAGGDRCASLYGEQGRADPRRLQWEEDRDGYLLAALSQLAPEQIQGMIKERQDGRYQVSLPDGRSTVVERPGFDNHWVTVLERAVEDIRAQSGEDTAVRHVARGVELMTGRPAQVLWTICAPDQAPDPHGVDTAIDGRKLGVVHEFLSEAAEDGRMVVVDGNGVACAVTTYDPDTRLVGLRNSCDEVFGLSLEEFHASISALAVEKPERRRSKRVAGRLI